jgi:hypothetical protein
MADVILYDIKIDRGKNMKKVIIFIISILFIQAQIRSNPVDNTAIAKLSELVFDDSTHWTMELLFPFDGYQSSSTDSIIFRISNIEAKLKVTYPDGIQIGVINADSLSVPLFINRNGDKIEIDTYSHRNSIQMLRQDLLIFGDYKGASVGKPVSGYSIIRNFVKAERNPLNIDCLTKKPSLGVFNDTLGLGALMKGNIYDNDNKPVTKLKGFPVFQEYYFEKDTPLTIYADGTYQTQIFRKFEKEMKDHLSVGINNFPGWSDTVAIEPIELKDIHPDTVVVQDIHLKNNEYVLSSVKNNVLPESEALILINYPNPFNSSTNFYIKVPEKLKRKQGDICIYNTSGRFVKKIILKEGLRSSWDGTNENGHMMPSGLYYYQLNIDKQMIKSCSMILLK